MAKKTKKKVAKKATKIAKKTVKKVAKANGVGVLPLGERVLVKPEEQVADERSPYGIIIPDSAKKEKAERGVVVAVGEGRRTDSGSIIHPRVSVGDTVMFSKYGFDEVTIDGTDYVIVSEPSILAIIK